MTRLRPLSIRHALEPARKPAQDETSTTTEVYERQDFRYVLDGNRMIVVSAYVSVDFSASYGKKRPEMIKEVVRKHASWFFSYGERVFGRFATGFGHVLPAKGGSRG